MRRTGAWRAPLVSILVCLAILATFIVVEQPFLRAELVGFGDDGSHDMLVEDAKHLSLLHGHYSRVGFYHPGPFLLWVYALSELVFHDLLGVASILSSKTLGIFALWIVTLTIVERIYHDVLRNRVGSLLAVAVSVALIVSWEPYALIFTFFPTVTVSSALLFFASGGALVAGCFGWIWAFALAGFALLHEHASFVVLVPLMSGIFVVAALWVNSELRTVRDLRGVYTRHRASVFAAIAISSLFLLPIVLETVIHFPGELPKYFAFADLPKANDWTDVAESLLRHWQFAWPVVLVLLFRRSGWKTPITLATLSVFISGTIVAAFYARRGVDDLGRFAYTIGWYQAVPAVCAAFVLGRVARANAKALFLVPVAVLLFVVVHGRWPTAPFGDAEVRAVAVTLDFLRREGTSRPRPLTLTVDYADGSPSRAWENVLAILSTQGRLRERLVCIDADTWYISYHAKNRCEPARVPPDRIYIATVGDEPLPAIRQPAGFRGLRIYAVNPLDVLDSQLEWKEPLWRLVHPQLVTGFWPMESDHVWTEGSARLRFKRSAATQTRLRLAFAVPASGREQRIAISSDDTTLWNATTDGQYHEFDVIVAVPASSRPEPTGYLEITTDPTFEPAEIGLPDQRTLGIDLRRVDVLPD